MATVELDTIVTGRLPIPEPYAFRDGHPLRMLKAVCLAHVLRHPQAGVLLVDTGFHPRAASDRRAEFGTAVSLLFRALRPQPFDAQLRERGIEPRDVETVLMTHLHADHTSGMRLLDRARFRIARREWEAAAAPRAATRGYVAAHLPPAERVEPVDFDGNRHGPFAATTDVLGDGSVRLVSTPGHTPGHLSVLVQTARGEVLLAGDAAYTRRNVERQVLPLMSVDAAAQRRSLAELKAFADAGGPVVPSHDPDAFRELA